MHWHLRCKLQERRGSSTSRLYLGSDKGLRCDCVPHVHVLDTESPGQRWLGHKALPSMLLSRHQACYCRSGILVKDEPPCFALPLSCTRLLPRDAFHRVVIELEGTHQCNPSILDFLASRTMSQINLYGLWVTQFVVFCCGNIKQTEPSSQPVRKGRMSRAGVWLLKCQKWQDQNTKP
jgi:hypothetical protein